MFVRILKKAYNKALGPKMGRIDGFHSSLLLAAIEANEIGVVVEDPPEGGVVPGSKRVWEDGAWRKPAEIEFAPEPTPDPMLDLFCGACHKPYAPRKENQNVQTQFVFDA